MKIHNFLKQKRLAAGVSQKTLSDALGFSSGQTISNIERGLCGVPLSQVKKICKILGVSKSEIKQILISDYKEKLDRRLGK